MTIDPNRFIPQIWADTILASMIKSQAHWSALYTAEQATHEHRMATDPDYARAFVLRQAENEAESYWLALYDNQLSDQEEEDY